MNRGSRLGMILVAALALLGGAGLAATLTGAVGTPAATAPTRLAAGSGAGQSGARPAASTEPGDSSGGSPASSAEAGVPAGSGSPGPSVTPSTSVSPTPSPSPSLVPDPLTGRLVSPAVAARHPIAVMIDDLAPARPQSGFSAASIVWQAPAEGGIPRYMMIFADQVPGNVGPVRSSRYYFIAWAAEWRAAYAHAGGSPQALHTLATQGHGQLVYNVDQFNFDAPYFWRISTRFAPHNLYTDGRQLRKMAGIVGATAPPAAAAWTFAPDAPLADRPTGGYIQVLYPANRIDYTYDRTTNTYLRSVSWGQPQVDATNGKRVAPKNVVVMLMRFGPLNDGHPQKERLEATVVGSGRAWIATNGRTIKGTWVKKSLTGPTIFVHSKGQPVTLTVGQTFIQVLPIGSQVTIVNGKLPAVKPTPKPTPAPRRLIID
jgi:Protein of unknown function (DUF3048) N-terminal domain/Protein of unknown function (DUF3048) C-terminal domain